MPDPVAAQRQFLVQVNGIDGYWATKTGGAKTSEVQKVYDGGSRTPEILAGPPQVADITVGRPWRPTRDAEIVRRLSPVVGAWDTSIAITPTDADLVPVGRPRVFHGRLVNLTDPETDAGSADPARLELGFAIGSDA